MALEAGQAAGGDKRGRESAALLVSQLPGQEWWAGVDLRVDLHADPVADLRRIFDARAERWRQIAEEERKREQS